jgi:hypothetical protein
MSTALTRPEDIYAALSTESLYDTIDGRKLAIMKSRMPGLTDVEVAGALELAASQGLNPWNNELYAAKGDGGRILVMVGRDGLLRKAEEFPDYAGYDCGVVYVGDEFVKGDPDADGKTLRARAGVRHVQGAPGKEEQIIGAWAVAERRGRPPRYFFARFDEYRAGKHAKSPWGQAEASGASGSSVMIEKVAISVVHRTLCNLSGIYLPEEVERARGGAVDGAPSGEEELLSIAELITGLDAPTEVKDRLQDGIRRLNDLSPNAWGVGRAQMTLPGRDVEGLIREAEEVERQIREAEDRRARRAAEEEVTDAVVVEEGTPEEGGAPQPDGVDDESTLCPICARPGRKHSDEEFQACQARADVLAEEEAG